MPGDVCVLRMTGGAGYVDPKAINLCRAELGLDRSYAAQFLTFIWDFVHFDFGKSMWTGRRSRKRSTPLRALAADRDHGHDHRHHARDPARNDLPVKQNTWIDYVVRGFSIAGIAMPSFWLGMLIILGLLITTKAVFGSPWMPPIKYVTIWVDPLYNLSMTIFPALATGYRYSAVATRMTRSALLEVLREDYVRTARAKGLVQKLIIRRHALETRCCRWSPSSALNSRS